MSTRSSITSRLAPQTCGRLAACGVSTLACLLLLAAVAGGQSSASRGASQPALARIETAQVFFLNDLQLPAQEAGVLTRIDVSEGHDVTAGQLLALVDDRKPQLAKLAANLDQAAATARAEDNIDVDYAIASHDVALSELEKDLSINARSPGAVPDTEIQIKRLSEHRARLQIEKSKLDKRVAVLTAEVQGAAVKAADETIRRCRIEAEFDGEVVDVLKRKGEWVNVGEPVLRIARMDRLRVDGRLDAAQFDAHEIEGRPVTVTAQLARGRTADFRGRLVFVSQQVEAGNKYRVRAEVENRQENGEWVLRPGLPTSMVVHLE